MVGPRFFLRVFTAGALLAFAVCARADALRADFSPLTLRPRTNAPAIFDLKLHRAGGGLLEGALEITFEAEGEVLLRQRTQDLTLAAGTQSFRVIAPPLPPHESYSGTEARLRFVTRTAAVELGRFPVEAFSRGARNFVIAVCDAHAAGGREVALWQSLRLEGFLPVNPNADRLIATSPAFLAPEDFPANPLALFAFDLVLLDGDGFALLREKQLAALTRWVEAGGSLCVLPGRGLKEEHVRFLNGFASGKDAAPFQITDTGEWRPTDGRPRLRHAGLGRVVIAPHPGDDALGADDWRRAAAFLWKMRATISEQLLAGTQWGAAKTPWAEPKESQGRREQADQYLQQLLPRSTRLLAPGLIALLLGGFLFVVGPLDWFALGALRRRRWTWIVFPLAAAGCTALVIETAGRSLGREDHRAALTVTDVGSGGRVLRESRLELFFTARNRDAQTEVRNAFAVPAVIGTRRAGMRSSEENVEPVSFSGQMPAHYTMRQQLRQWTPQFNRVTTLETASGPDAAVPWAEIETAFAGGTDSAAKLQRLKTVGQRHALSLYLFHGELSPASATTPAIPPGIAGLCRGPKSGFAGFFSRSAPDASADASDLPLIDPSDPDEWLLVISRETPDGVHLYRRLFRTDD